MESNSMPLNACAHPRHHVTNCSFLTFFMETVLAFDRQRALLHIRFVSKAASERLLLAKLSAPHLSGHLPDWQGRALFAAPPSGQDSPN
eukprot:1138738-Amphidinium_carterae.1